MTGCLIVARGEQVGKYYQALDRVPCHLDQRKWDNVAEVAVVAAEAGTDSGCDFGAAVVWAAVTRREGPCRTPQD